VDKLVRVEDEELRKSMGLMFEKMKFAVEPACAAATAALFGPLRETMSGKTVVLIFCGSNIDWETYADQAIFEHGYVA
jgi:threonine dehydratase